MGDLRRHSPAGRRRRPPRNPERARSYYACQEEDSQDESSNTPGQSHLGTPSFAALGGSPPPRRFLRRFPAVLRLARTDAPVHRVFNPQVSGSWSTRDGLACSLPRMWCTDPGLS